MKENKFLIDNQAALKNAFALLGKRRYVEAIGFFLLGGQLKDALDIAETRLKDLQLTLLIAKLYSGEEEFLKIVKRTTESGDPFLTSISLWLDNEYIKAVDCLVDSKSKFYDTAKVFTFFRFLSRSPMYIKAKSLSGVKPENHSKLEQELYLKAAVSHLSAQCPIPGIVLK